MNKTHAPTKTELNDAIASILKQNKSADLKEVSALLVKEHATWNIPERRLSKFLKRQKKSSSSEDSQDNDVSIVGTVSRRAKGMFNKIRHPRRKDEMRPESAPIIEFKQTLMPATSNEEPSHVQEVAEERLPVTEDEPEKVEEAHDKDLVYLDDNDGKKHGGLFCEPCQGCTIL